MVINIWVNDKILNVHSDTEVLKEAARVSCGQGYDANSWFS